MTIAEVGPHDWVNYTDYWRDIDAEWLQARSILRVNNYTDLVPPSGTSIIPTPGVGQMVYVKNVAASQTDVLFLYASKGNAGTPGWIPYPALPKFLYASTDDATKVVFGHHPGNPANVVPAVSLSPTGLSVVSDLTVRNGVLTVSASDIRISTGGNKTVVLTTDGAGLVSDMPIKAGGFTSTGPITATNQNITAGTVTATSTLSSDGPVTAKSTLAVTSTLTAGGLNVSGDRITLGSASPGTGASLLYTTPYSGSAVASVLRGANFVAGKTQLIVHTDYVQLYDGTTYVDNQMMVRGGRSVFYYNSAGTFTGYGAGVYYGAAPTNPANGTIWVS